MREIKVLVAHASKRGSTAEIAQAIADALHQEQLAADVLPAKKVRDLAGYDAVILGSAVYAFRWRPQAVRFLRRFRRQLTTKPVWLFSSRPLDASAESGSSSLPTKIRARAEDIGVRGEVTFGGRLGADAKGFIASKMARGGKAGDFRNFEQIRAWAAGVAREIDSTCRAA